MPNSHAADYDQLLQRKEHGWLKKPAEPEQRVRDSDTQDPDKKGYYELLAKVQRSRDSASLKAG